MNQTGSARDFSARASLLERLELARNQVADGKHYITEQRHLIDELKGNGRATVGAVEFLNALEITQALRLTHRDRLELALASDNAD